MWSSAADVRVQLLIFTFSFSGSRCIRRQGFALTKFSLSLFHSHQVDEMCINAMQLAFSNLNPCLFSELSFVHRTNRNTCRYQCSVDIPICACISIRSTSHREFKRLNFHDVFCQPMFICGMTVSTLAVFDTKT